MSNRLFPALVVAALAAGCASTPPVVPPSPPATASTPDGLPVVVERFVTAALPGAELDSLATWPTPDGATWLIATAKLDHQLVVFDADTGAPLRTVGNAGEAPGDFDRPNGVAVHGAQLFVSERDNRRVQVFALPTFAPLLDFGRPALRSPYGLWVHETAPDTVEVYVTDSFMDGPDFGQVPPLDQLDRRVHRYRVAPDDDGALQAQALGTFGDTRAATALRIVESIAGDAGADRLLIADEDLRDGATVRGYDLAGRPTGDDLPGGSFLAEPEGIALWACSVDGGYWIVADQLRPLTVFRLFDRQTLAPAGAFTGAAVAYTDGIVLHAAGTRRFAHGALYAVHDDRAIGAFDLAEIARTLQLDPACAG